MPHRGVPAASAIYILTPGDGVVSAHRSTGIGRLVEARQDVDCIPRIAAEVVPFVDPLPFRRQTLRRRVVGVLDADRGALDLRVAHHSEPVVSADLSDPPGGAPAGRAGVPDDPPRIPARHL